MRILKQLSIAAAVALIALVQAGAQRLLVPMDDAQQNHLKAYGLTYNAIKASVSAEWLLNYRGGSFLLGDTPELRRQAGRRGVRIQPVNDAQVRRVSALLAS